MIVNSKVTSSLQCLFLTLTLTSRERACIAHLDFLSVISESGNKHLTTSVSRGQSLTKSSFNLLNVSPVTCSSGNFSPVRMPRFMRVDNLSNSSTITDRSEADISPSVSLRNKSFNSRSYILSMHKCDV